MFERINNENMENKEKTIYLLDFALEVIKDNELGNTKNSDNWTIGKDLEEHLQALKQSEDVVLHSVSVSDSEKVAYDKGFHEGGNAAADDILNLFFITPKDV